MRFVSVIALSASDGISHCVIVGDAILCNDMSFILLGTQVSMLYDKLAIVGLLTFYRVDDYRDAKKLV